MLNLKTILLKYKHLVAFLFILFSLVPDLYITYSLNINSLKAQKAIFSGQIKNSYLRYRCDLTSDVDNSIDHIDQNFVDYVQGLAYWYGGDCTKAIELFLNENNFNLDRATNSFFGGLLLGEVGEYDQSAEIIKKVNAVDLIFYILKEAYLNKDYESVSKWLSILSHLNDSQITTKIINYAWSFYSKGEQQQSLEFLNLYLSVMPEETTENLRINGMIARVQGQSVEAIRYFERALEIQPNNVDILYRLRTFYTDSGQYNRGIEIAIKELELIVDKDQRAEQLVNIAVIYRLNQNYIESIEYLNQALLLRPNWWPIYNELGMSYCHLSIGSEAEEYFSKAKILATGHPEGIQLQKNIIRCDYLLGNVSIAIKSAELLIEQQKADSRLIDLYLDLGTWYLSIGDIEGAKRIYAQGLIYWPNAPWFINEYEKLFEQ